jgi:hypothetical protein
VAESRGHGSVGQMLGVAGVLPDDTHTDLLVQAEPRRSESPSRRLPSADHAPTGRRTPHGAAPARCLAGGALPWLRPVGSTPPPGSPSRATRRRARRSRPAHPSRRRRPSTARRTSETDWGGAQPSDRRPAPRHATKASPRERPSRDPRTPTCQGFAGQSWWARGELNPHVLADTGT